MSVRARHTTGLVASTVVSWRYLAHRFSFIFFLILAAGLLVFSHQKPYMAAVARTRMVDGVAPVLDAFSRPLAATREIARNIGDYFHLREENLKLREQLAELQRWQNMALVLDNENKDLRKILRYKLEPSLAYISARVIADVGGGYARALVVTAGRTDGVREGMAAMTGDGLVGRVVEVGEWSSRILLISDANSRIPVTILSSNTQGGEHAIMAGGNEAQPSLLYLPQDANIRQGDRVVTSGHGGIFPPNLPVGVALEKSADGYRVEPFASLGRINQVRLVDFALEGGVLNPLAAQLESAPASPR